MSTNETQSSVQEKTRAVALAALMVTSVLAMSVSFAGAAAAESANASTVWEENISGVDIVESMEYDESAGVLLAAGVDTNGNSLVWAIDPGTQTVQWSASVNSTATLDYNANYVVVGSSSGPVEVVDRSAGQSIATYSTGDSSHSTFNDVEIGTNYVYVAGNAYPEVLEVDGGTNSLVSVGTIDGQVGYEGAVGLSIDNGELSLVSGGVDSTVSVLDITANPFGYTELAGKYVEDYDINSYSPYDIERNGDNLYVLDGNTNTGAEYVRALTYDSGTGSVTQSWLNDYININDLELANPIESSLSVDARWVYVDRSGDSANPDYLSALNRSDGTVAWSADQNTSSTVEYVSSFAAVHEDQTVDVYAGFDGGSAVLIGAFSDGIAPTDSDTTSGTISTTVDAPHPDVNSLSVESTNPGDDITQTGVGQPGTEYNVSVTLDGDLSEVDRVDVEMFRADASGNRIASSPTADEYYNFTINFDSSGAATVSSAHGSDGHLNISPVEGINRSASTDDVVVSVTFPDDVRPSANTQDSTVNGYSWKVESTPVNEDILNDLEPTTTTESFEMGVLVDANINVGQLERGNSTAFPGSNNVSLVPSGTENAVSVQAGGNVEIGVEMSAGDLQQVNGDDTIPANRTKVLAGQGHTYADHNHTDVTTLSNAPVDVGANTLAHGQQEEFRMWVDYPQEIEPGEYNGEFTFTVKEVGAS